MIVTLAGAARLAGVSRQAIRSLKMAHTKRKRHYPFFCQDPKTKKIGVDIDNLDWRLYLARNKYNPCKKDRQQGLLKITDQGQPDGTTVEIFINLLKIVERAVSEIMDPSRLELRKIKKLCMELYQAGKNNE